MEQVTNRMNSIRIQRDIPSLRHAPPDLRVACVQDSSKCVTLRWSRSRYWLPRDTVITVTDATTQLLWQWRVSNAGNPQVFKIPAEILQAGHQYKVKVTDHTGASLLTILPHCLLDTTSADLQFRAELSKSELRLLLQRAEDFVLTQGKNTFRRCEVLYRNKMPAYYEDILQNHGGIMKVYKKDNNGDPGSPINDVLKGLFFAANVDGATGKPPKISNFGTLRTSIPAIHMLQTTPHVYFTDFYCNNKPHYVTLVLTRPGSQADVFCAKKLLRVDLSNNPFFRVDFASASVRVTKNILVELFYTEDIDLSAVSTQHGAYFTTTRTRGVSKPNGLPKRRSCKICNLY